MAKAARKADLTTSVGSSTGAPASTRQASRKGKAAWRKNIDLSGVEAQLENDRAAERAGLAPVSEKTASAALFVEDRRGDENVRKRSAASGASAGKKPLKSLAILHANRDVGAPAVTGRARRGVDVALQRTRAGRGGDAADVGGLTPEQRARRSGMSKKEMERLRRAAGRETRGAFGVIEEDAEANKGRRGPEAVIGEAAYDVWSSKPLALSDTNEDEQSSGQRTKGKPVRAPSTLADKRVNDVSLALPDAGQSYNPSAEAHEALLNKALRNASSEEERRQIELDFMRKWREAAEVQRHRGKTTADEVGRILGMQVDMIDGEDKAKGEENDDYDDDEDDDADSDDDDVRTGAPKKPTMKRKTKQQRAKAKKLKEEIRAREAVKLSKRSRAQLQSLRALKKELALLDDERLARIAKRKEARQRRLDEKVGMFKLPKREEEVQLGEDLAESLRTLKPEGNLLRDRVYAFQRRGLIEPKHTAVAGRTSKARRPSARVKEYETHSYKRFS